MSLKIEAKILLLPVICRTWLAIDCRYLCISCLIDINECNDTSLLSCPNRTECVNLQGNYTCECAPGYGSTASGKTRGLDIQCEGEIIFDLEGSGELELFKHSELSNPQTTRNSGNSLKRSIFSLWSFYWFICKSTMRLRNERFMVVSWVLLIKRIVV